MRVPRKRYGKEAGCLLFSGRSEMRCQGADWAVKKPDLLTGELTVSPPRWMATVGFRLGPVEWLRNGNRE
jgi:hypothetical protein